MWHCETGCMEQRQGDLIGAGGDEWWLKKQAVPQLFKGDVSVICCTDCSNAYNPWLRDQDFWKEYLVLEAREMALKADVDACVAGAAERLSSFWLTENADWMKKSGPLITAWFASRKVITQKANDERKARLAAQKEAAKR